MRPFLSHTPILPPTLSRLHTAVPPTHSTVTEAAGSRIQVPFPRGIECVLRSSPSSSAPLPSERNAHFLRKGSPFAHSRSIRRCPNAEPSMLGAGPDPHHLGRPI